MPQTTFGRRAFLQSGAATGLAVAAAPTSATPASDDAMTFEITRSDAEWRDRLTAEEYQILREGGTEPAKSSPLWNEERPGTYRCRGCDLVNYHSQWKVILDLGWAFFRHPEPLAIVVGVDGAQAMIDSGEVGPQAEAVCRRCGSHLGHIVAMGNELLHCINGAALAFEPRTV